MNKKPILFARNCNICKKEFVYCIKSGKDLRCYWCKQNNMTKEDVEKELAEMSKEEYESFLKDIEEYEKENGKIK